MSLREEPVELVASRDCVRPNSKCLQMSGRVWESKTTPPLTVFTWSRWRNDSGSIRYHICVVVNDCVNALSVKQNTAKINLHCCEQWGLFFEATGKVRRSTEGLWALHLCYIHSRCRLDLVEPGPDVQGAGFSCLFLQVWCLMLIPLHVLGVSSKHVGAGNSVRSDALFSCLPWWPTHPHIHATPAWKQTSSLGLLFFPFTLGADLRFNHFDVSMLQRPLQTGIFWLWRMARWTRLRVTVRTSGSEGLLEEKKQCGKRKQKLCCSLYLLPS